jgi:Sulfotransferase family
VLPKPVIVIGCNRSGTTLLFNNLSAHPDTWSLYIESQDIFYRHYPIHPQCGDRLEHPPSPEIANDIRRYFYRQSHNKERFKDAPVLRYLPRKLLQRPLNPLYKRAPIRLVEKTPANSLRIPFLVSLFPDARFLFLVRRGEDVVSSLMEGWKNWSRTGDGKWRFGRWHYLVPPDWQDWRDRSLPEICAYQWIKSTMTAWEDLTRHRAGDFLLLRHEELMADPPAGYRCVMDFCQLRDSPFFWSQIAKIRGRVFTTGGSAPRREKWRDLHGAEIESVRHLLQPINALFYD